MNEQGFNLLQLHCPEEDSGVRKLLRVYSVISRFDKKAIPLQSEQASRINEFLKKTNKNLNNEIGPKWKSIWLESIGYDFARLSYKDWFLGRASIPLVALKVLGFFGLQEEIIDLVKNCDFFCSTTGRVFKVPHEITSDLSYLAGAILGDGHITKAEYRISFKVSEEWLAKKFVYKIKTVFNHEVRLHAKSEKNRKMQYCADCDNKPAVRIFTKFFNIPKGKKSHIIEVPEIILESPAEIKKAFLEGVFDTDGGKRRGGFGLTTASQKFRGQLALLLESFGITVHKDEWVNKKYNKSYYGLQFNRKNPNLDFICTGTEARLNGMGLGSRQ